MQKPQGYDEAEAKVGGGDFPTPDAGGYVAKIVSAETKKSAKGNEMLVLSVDIAEGEFKDHYTKLSEKFEKSTYPNIYQLTEGEHVNYFKGLIAAIEHSNNGFKFNFDEKTLIGKRLGINLREEEYLNKDKEVKTIMKVAYFCSAEEARAGLPALKPKTLNGGQTQSKQVSQTAPTAGSDPSDLPF